MNNVFRDDYFIDVTGDKPTLCKAYNSNIEFSLNSAARFLGFDFIIGIMFLSFCLLNNAEVGALVILAVLWSTITLIGVSCFNFGKGERLYVIDVKETDKDMIVKKPENLTDDEWNKFVATLLIGKTPNKHGKIWMKKKERKSIKNFVVKNQNISNQLDYEKRKEQYKIEQIAQDKKDAENVIKYKNNVNGFIDENISNSVQ